MTSQERRELLRAIGAATMGGALAGCTDQNSDGSGEQETTTGGPDGQKTTADGPSGGGTPADDILNEVAPTPAATLHPLHFTLFTDLKFLSRLWERPMYMDTDNNVQPWLVTEWESNDDFTEWTWTLREGVEWHDGESFTADDLAFTLGLIKRENFALSAPFAEFLVEDQIDVVDEHTVVTTLNDPYPDMHLGLIDAITLVPKHVWENVDDPTGSFKGAEFPTGTGPFVLEEYERESYYRYSVNENYWGDLPDGVKGHELEIVPNTDTRLLRIQRGTGDLLGLVNPGQRARQLDSQEGSALVQNEAMVSMQIIFQTDQFPMDHRAVRQAISTAIPRNNIVTTLFADLTPPADSLMPKAYGEWHTGDVNTYDYDTEGAKKILRDAGWTETTNGWESPDGEPLEFELIIPNTGVEQRLSGIIKGELSKANIPMNIRSVDPSTHTQKFFVEHDFQMSISSGGWWLDPLLALDFWLKYKGTGPESRDGYRLFNVAHFNDEEFNQLHTEARKTTNRDERVQQVHRLQEILGEQVPWYPITYTGPWNIWGVNTKTWSKEAAEEALVKRYGLISGKSYSTLAPKYE